MLKDYQTDDKKKLMLILIYLISITTITIDPCGEAYKAKET